MKSRKGKFIVFEGLNGSGKSTQARFLAERLTFSGEPYPWMTYEPNDLDDYGKRAREMLSKDSDPYENNLIAARLFSFNRRTHNKKIEEELSRRSVISDRYWHSNFAYQGAQGVSFREIARLNEGLMIPDITFLLSISPEESFERIFKRKNPQRKFEKDLNFASKVATNYLSLPFTLPSLLGDSSIVLIDASKSKGEVFEKILDAYRKKFPEKGASF